MNAGRRNTRLEEFEPLKNADGDNSPESVRQALSTHYVQWMSAAGHQGAVVAGKGIEISPLVAMDATIYAHTILKGKEPES